ncbi:hypothetical protein BPY_22800 [Bifidobacterium psychraerophilum]|uniref:phage tail tube protein n=1 Tax=Bifidobacterium psychraerophilum TaxID=218140 RepID=UPI00310F0582
MAFEDPAPAYIESDVKTVFTPAIANISAPTVAELTAAAATELSKWIVADGWKPTRSQDFVDHAVEGVGSVGKIPGRKSFDNTEVQIYDNVNGGETTPNVAAETLTEGKEGYFVRRRSTAVAASSPFKAGDVVSVYRVTIGAKDPVAHSGNDLMQSVVSFGIDPDSVVETAIVATGE